MKEARRLLLAVFGILAACQQKHPAAPVVTNPDYQRGMSLLNRKNDSAYYYLNRVATGSKDSLMMATVYNTMAHIESDEGDYYGGQETVLTSLKYLHPDREKDQAYLLADYSLLGSINSDLKNYDVAISYIDRAIPLIKDEGYRVIALNNKALAYQKKGDYASAIAIYASILDSSKKLPKEYARVLTNLAITKWQRDQGYRAAADLLTALAIRRVEKDDWGLNSSYAHLADYYFSTRPDLALVYAQKMYAVAVCLQSPDDELEALQKLVRLSPPIEAENYFNRYLRLNDSLQTARTAAKNQFALIRYEAEKNKADYLRLEQENVRQRVVLYGSIVSALLLVGFIIAWYSRRNLRIKSQAQDRQLKTMQKIHDVLANGIYRVMSRVEHGDKVEKGPLLDDLEELYERSRDISYEEPEVEPKDLQQAVARLLMAFSRPGTDILIVGNEPALWAQVTPTARREVIPVLEELMVNMRKHSRAVNVHVGFESQESRVAIHYTDDGVGFPPDQHYGNGLTNTENRIKRIGGRITFGKHTPRGVKIDIYLPINRSK